MVGYEYYKSYEFWIFLIIGVLFELLTNNIKSNLTLTYICFILWAIGSLFYAINPTEVVVNLARQINVFIMFFSMGILINGLKDKLRFFSWVITILIIIENYAV